MRAVEQIIIPGVPAFLFVAGVFAAFASGKLPGWQGWRWIPRRLVALLIPYLIWSLVTIASDYALGERASATALFRLLLVGGTAPGFYFIPLLCQLYLLSPLIVPLARRHWRALLLASALIQIVAQSARYAAHLHLVFPGSSLLAWFAPSWFFPSNLFWFAFGVVLGFHSAELLGGIVRRFGSWLVGVALLVRDRR
jgi:fucose 4-O-acetylase-like acetyltransferase